MRVTQARAREAEHLALLTELLGGSDEAHAALFRCPTLLRTRVTTLRAGWDALLSHVSRRATAEEWVRRSPDLLAQFSR